MDTDKIIVLAVSVTTALVVIIWYIVSSHLWLKKEKEKINKFRKLYSDNIVLTSLEACTQSEAFDKGNIEKYKEKLEYYANENFNCIMRSIDKASLKSLYRVNIPYYFLITPSEDIYEKFNLDMVTIIRNLLEKLGYKVYVTNINMFQEISPNSPSMVIEWRRE